MLSLNRLKFASLSWCWFVWFELVGFFGQVGLCVQTHFPPMAVHVCMVQTGSCNALTHGSCSLPRSAQKPCPNPCTPQTCLTVLTQGHSGGECNLHEHAAKKSTSQGLGNLGGVALAPFCHPDPSPGGSYRPVPVTSSFKPLLGRVLRLSGLHNCLTMGTQGPNIVPPSAHGHYVPIFMGLPCPQGPWGIFVQVVSGCHLM